MKNLVAVVAALALLLALAAGSGAREVKRDFERSFEVQDGFCLYLDFGDGDVDIQPWDENTVKVSVFYHADIKTLGGGPPDFDVEFREGDDAIYIIGVENPTSPFLGLRTERVYNYTYTIKAPRYLDLDLTGDDGDVTVQGWAGRIECALDDGDVSLSELAAPSVRIRLEDGDVRIGGSAGELLVVCEDGDIVIVGADATTCRIEVDDGDVTIKESSGTLEIAAEDGRVTLRDVTAPRLDIKTDDGSVDVSLVETESPEIEIETSDGGVMIDLERGTSAAISIRVADGNIDADLSGWDTLEKGEDWLSGEIHGGRGRIRIRTDDGDVFLREAK